jgi:hypothetical protein
VLSVFDLGRFVVAEFGRLVILLLLILLITLEGVTSLGRRELAADERDGSVADLGVTLSRSEYFSGAYL